MPKRAPKVYHMMYTQQLKHLPVKDIYALIDRIKKKIKPLRYGLIFHDKDIDENGNPVEGHVHVMMSFENARSTKNVAKLLGDEAQYIEKWDDKWQNGYAYLIHRTKGSQLKHQYDVSDVISNFDFKKLIMESEKIAEYAQPSVSINPLLDAIVTGQISRKDAEAMLNGSQLARNIKLLDAAQAKFLEIEAEKWRKQKIEENAIVHVVWIFGLSGTGKSSLAKEMAKRRGEPYYFSGSERDIYQGYNGEHTIILDEFRALSSINYSDILKMFDPFSLENGVMAPARYKDKALACDLFIVTSPYSPTEYYNEMVEKGMLRKDLDSVDQLLRRITLTIEMNDTEYYAVEYDFFARHYQKVENTARYNPYSAWNRPTKPHNAIDIFNALDNSVPLPPPIKFEQMTMDLDTIKSK